MFQLRLIPALLLAVAASLPTTTFANEDPSSYPTRPIKLLVGFAAGGSTDVIARQVATGLSRELGQSVVVENRTGAGGAVAAEALSKGAADGYTLMICTNGVLTSQKHLMKNLRYSDKDLAPISQLAVFPYILLAHPSVQVQSLQEFITLARQKPGSISYGSAGIGSGGHLATELFGQVAGVKMTHVPYKGSGEVVRDLVAGHIPVAFDQEVAVQSFVTSGRLKPLAIAYSARSKTMPSVPTFRELGVPFEATAWAGLCGRAGTPPAILRKVSDATRKVMADKELRERFESTGMTPLNQTPDEFAKFINVESDVQALLIRSLNISLE